MGQPPIIGPPDRHVSELGCGRINRIQNDPEGSSGILDTASQTSSNVSADRLNIGTVGRVATSVGATPSSYSGIHSWKEQWENMSELSSDDASGQPVQPDWNSPERVYMSDIRTPPNTEEEGDSDYPWRDRMVSRISCGSSSDTRGEENNGCSYSTVSGVASERYADIAVLSDFSDESEEADRTRLADGRGPETGQPILILDDVAPLPVIGGYGRYFAREIIALAMAEGYRPESSMAWGDKRIPPKRFWTVFRIYYKRHWRKTRMPLMMVVVQGRWAVLSGVCGYRWYFVRTAVAQRLVAHVTIIKTGCLMVSWRI